ncbi:ligand-binding sensor domain-containing protein [Kriegella aquimaris]|uniref:Two component regulator propeller n=1 Tax=Kriegella aquimaris TaxID=192904 RepID=A0A1G9W2R4_9FLAO|nr:two-component regulator propeller domain-containing protein [Kriegella aquimaris]SDM78809.1 Two component regulator propeller [Kriegella aquimaris]
MKILLLTLLTILSVSCNSQEKKIAEIKNPTEKNNASQIGQYVVETFQDSKGNLWFGTLEKGVAKYDGNKLTYLTTKNGLPSNRITNVIEDKAGNLWFGTGTGISKFDGKTFTNFSKKDGLCSDMISNLLIDSKGNFWIGTWGGVCKFDGTQFENLPIPYPKIETKINQDTKDWITTIREDKEGNIWFGRDGYGASKFNGNSFVHFTTKEGLNSNNVQSIAEDKEGNIWIGTRVAEKDNADTDKRIGEGGLNKFDRNKFVHFSEINGLSKSDVFTIHNDKSNDLWISSTSNGVYKYTNNEFVNYKVPTSTMSFLKDKKGIIWLGCAGGLYKIDKDGKTINVTTNGPWE